MAPMRARSKNAKGHATVNAVTPFAFADLGNAPHSLRHQGRDRADLTG
jgi:hypothetical protein